MQIEEKMLESQELADNWREIKDLRSNLECRLLEAEQLLQSMLRRPAELEPKVAQNQLDQAQVSDSFVSRWQPFEDSKMITNFYETWVIWDFWEILQQICNYINTLCTSFVQYLFIS